jgi:arylsulfatase A-like enzyme
MVADTKPNFVLFMPDQLRYDSLGCSGNAFIRTPNIDNFANLATRFTNCFVQHSVCSQSRCSMFTSKYPHVTGHRSLESLIQPWEANFFRTMKENGYHVAVLAPRGDLFAPEVSELCLDEYGFVQTPDIMPNFTGDENKINPTDINNLWDRLYYEGRRDMKRVLDYDEAAVVSAEMWLENAPKGPWVLFLPLLFPHQPFGVEEPYFSLYDRKQIPLASPHTDKTGYEPQYMARLRKEFGLHRCTPDIWQEVKATYYGMISRLDDQFGRILQKVKRKSDIYTLFFTDHGEYMGDHGLIEKWPAGVSNVLTHIPFLIGGPTIPTGAVVDSMVEMVDLAPTIFDLAGVKEDFSHNGQSLVAVIRNPKLLHRQYAFSEGGFLMSEEPILEDAPFPYDIKSSLQHSDTELVGKVVSARSKEWTYVYRLYEPAELYNRTIDEGELRNLAADPSYVHITRMFETVVLRWMIETSGIMPLAQDPRFPTVKLPSPKEQYEQRKKQKSQ